MNSLSKGFTSTPVSQVPTQVTGMLQGASRSVHAHTPAWETPFRKASGECYEEKQTGGGWWQALQPVVGQGLTGTSENTSGILGGASRRRKRQVWQLQDRRMLSLFKDS